MSQSCPKTVSEWKTLITKLPSRDDVAHAGATDRNGQLTKPPGALGQLEDLAIWYAGWRGDARPAINKPQVVIFAGNHGVAAQGVSAFPAEVTEQMVMNFQGGGAAINQLCKTFGASLDVIALSLDTPTVDFTTGPAMDDDAFLGALAAGWNAVDSDTDLLVTGEMGIGNTTSAAAVAHALFDGAASDWTGRGTGVDDAGVDLKSRVVSAGLNANPSAKGSGLSALQCLGGRELAGMVGAILRARVLSIPVILDGFICSAAAACLHVENEFALDHCVAGHQSAEGAHSAVLKQLDKTPLLSLGLRLGEGSGAALAIGVLQGAVACHSGMATFAEASVSGG
jgi:nicotinate-nucleotide--dimethylbenzimidazole phosphoribosyltransferase